MGERAHIGKTLRKTSEGAAAHVGAARPSDRNHIVSRAAYPLAAQETNDFPVGLTPPTSDFVKRSRLDPKRDTFGKSTIP